MCYNSLKSPVAPLYIVIKHVPFPAIGSIFCFLPPPPLFFSLTFARDLVIPFSSLFFFPRRDRISAGQSRAFREFDYQYTERRVQVHLSSPLQFPTGTTSGRSLLRRARSTQMRGIETRNSYHILKPALLHRSPQQRRASRPALCVLLIESLYNHTVT